MTAKHAPCAPARPKRERCGKPEGNGGTGRRPVALASFAAGVLAALLSACGAPPTQPEQPALAAPAARGADSVPSSEPYRLGLEHFSLGEYGLSERYFREAVERSPKDAAAWIGLAASYDRLRRFDLADRAYESAIEISGETAEILNNQGYSQLLRGNLRAAKAKFQKALALQPDHPTLLNNMKLLESSAKYATPRAL